MSGTILPSLPPLADDYVVTVCIWCQKRCCLLVTHLRCPARMRSAEAETVGVPVKVLRAGKAEHESYWSHEDGDDLDMPKSIEEVAALAAHDRKKAIEKPEAGWTFQERARLFAGYLTEELGLDSEQCRDAIRDVWPEAAEAIESARLQIHADKMRESALQ